MHITANIIHMQACPYSFMYIFIHPHWYTHSSSCMCKGKPKCAHQHVSRKPACAKMHIYMYSIHYLC